MACDLQARLPAVYARLRSETTYKHLASLRQFDQLCDAVDLEHPGGADPIRHWPVWKKHALLNHLEAMNAKAPPARPWADPPKPSERSPT